MSNILPEPNIALELYVHKNSAAIQSEQVTALCGYIDEITFEPGDDFADSTHSIQFKDSSVEFVSGWVEDGGMELNASHINRWEERNFSYRSMDDFLEELESPAADARVMLIGSAAVESAFEELTMRSEQGPATLLANATTLAINRLRRSATSNDPSLAALADIRYLLRLQQNTEWAQEDPKEYQEAVDEISDAIRWHAQLQR